MSGSQLFAPKVLPWNERLGIIVETMREMSRQTDPQVMGEVYTQRMRKLMPSGRIVSLSRRNLSFPEFRVTRFSEWKEPPNPWKEKERLPLHSGGLFADLIYGNEPRLLNVIGLPESDPAHEYIGEMQSILAIPHYDRGEALNMVLQMRAEPEAFDADEVPELVWISNLYGRATHNLVLAEQVQSAFE